VRWKECHSHKKLLSAHSSMPCFVSNGAAKISTACCIIRPGTCGPQLLPKPAPKMKSPN